MFSSLPKLADKNFVVGFLLPTLLATFAVLFLCKDIGSCSSVYPAALNEKSFGKLTVLVLAVWLGATILMICNHVLYRVLEGYVGPFNRPRWRRQKQQTLLESRKQLARQYRTMTDPNKQASAEQKSLYYKDIRSMLEHFPNEEWLVLPTRFGNVIRSFETYPLQVYGVDSISAWLRLQAVIPKTFQSLVDDARAQVDFFVNTFFLSAGIALLAILLSALHFISIWCGYASMEKFDWTFPITICIATALMWIAYQGAISRAIAWGDMVKSSFDLYLPALAEKLGYKLPDNSDDRRRFWGDVNCMFLYWEKINPEKWTVTPVKTSG